MNIIEFPEEEKINYILIDKQIKREEIKFYSKLIKREKLYFSYNFEKFDIHYNSFKIDYVTNLVKYNFDIHCKNFEDGLAQIIFDKYKDIIITDLLSDEQLIRKRKMQKEIQSLVAVGARELGYDFSFNHLNTKRPSFWHQGKSVHKQITKIASSAKKQAKQYIKKMLQWCHRFCGSEGVLISSTIFLSYASEDAVLLVERKVIEKALHMVCHKGRDLGIDFTLELLERDFFRLRGRKHIVLLDKDNSCIPSIILKNIFIYPKDLAAPKKTYVMQASIKYINKETYGI